MKEDLISRKVAIEALNMNGCCGMGITYLLDCDSVPAVPLDKLCELCEETNARVPCVLCGKIMPEWCKENNNLPLSWNEEWKCPSWKVILAKWMEEQDAN